MTAHEKDSYWHALSIIRAMAVEMDSRGIVPPIMSNAAQFLHDNRDHVAPVRWQSDTMQAQQERMNGQHAAIA